jgi:hypothetical protein
MIRRGHHEIQKQKNTDELIWLLLRIMGTHLLIKAEDFEVKPFK